MARDDRTQLAPRDVLRRKGDYARGGGGSGGTGRSPWRCGSGAATRGVARAGTRSGTRSGISPATPARDVSTAVPEPSAACIAQRFCELTGLWCIGHIASSPCPQVHSAPCGSATVIHNASGTSTTLPAWQSSQSAATGARTRRNCGINLHGSAARRACQRDPDSSDVSGHTVPVPTPICKSLLRCAVSQCDLTTRIVAGSLNSCPSISA